MLKKILATALAAAMILGVASIASAASFSDTAGHAREVAIQRLAGLGLLNGYPDGSFKPGNPITRAEFAKVIVYAMGLKEAADMLSGGPVGFSDVAPTHWASGYISIAAAQNIVKGYPDGTFGPEKNVTYAEALTMILRAIGYEPVLSKAVWPVAYVTKAAELGINKGISFNASVNATRGDVAGLLANAVTVAKLIQVGYGDTAQYVVSGTQGTTKVCLLNDMGATSEDGWVVDSPDLFTNDGTKIKLHGAANTRTLATGTTATGLLGHKVRLWLNNDGKVFFVEDLTPAESVKAATCVDNDTVKITSTSKNVDLSGDIMFRNYAGPATIAVQSGDEITVIYDGDTPKYVVAFGYHTGVVDSVNLIYDRIAWADAAGSLNLQDHDITWSGAANSLDGLSKNDVIQYFTNADAKKAVLVVTRNSVTGSFTKLSGTTATVGGTDYKSATGAIGVEAPNLGKNVTILLNKDGKIVKMTAVSTTTASTTAVVVATGTYNDGFTTVNRVKLFNSDGSTVVRDVPSGCTYTGTSFATLAKGDVISYKVNSAGAINSITMKGAYATHVAALTVDDDYSLIAWQGANYKLTSATVVFDLRSFKDPTWDETAISVMTVEALLANSTVKGVVATDSGKATIVAITEGTAAASTDVFGAVYGKYQTVVSGAVKWVVRVLVDGAITDYTTDLTDAQAADLATKDIIKFQKLASGKIGSVVEPTKVAVSDAAYELRVSAIDLTNGLITVKEYDKTTGNAVSTQYYLVDKNTLYYDATGTYPASTSLNAISAYSKVDIYQTSGVVNVLKVMPE